MTQISPPNLEVGCSYLEVHHKSYTLFTVMDRTSINPNGIKFIINDYYFSSGSDAKTSDYYLEDFTSPIYALPSALTNDELISLYPELFL